MDVLYPCCAGLDVHAGSVTACVRIAKGAEVTYQHRTAPATTRGLLGLDAWLTTHGCTHVAMEATGVYWGSRCGMCWKPTSPWSSPTRCTSAMCRGAKAT